MVDVGKVAPQPQEALLQLAVVLQGKVAEKSSNHGTLLVGQVRDVVQLVDVAQIGEDAVGIGHVLVDVVEVRQQQLAPAVELVQRLLHARTLAERLVQVAHQLDGVGHHQVRLLAEEVADGDVGRAPEGLAGQPRQVLVQKQRGTLVGEYHGDARQVGAVLADDVLGHIF